MADHRRSLGRQAEDAAARFLEQAGLAIVERNVRFPRGELDLVCRDGGAWVFVEVKCRQARWGDARRRRSSGGSAGASCASPSTTSSGSASATSDAGSTWSPSAWATTARSTSATCPPPSTPPGWCEARARLDTVRAFEYQRGAFPEEAL